LRQDRIEDGASPAAPVLAFAADARLHPGSASSHSLSAQGPWSHSFDSIRPARLARSLDEVSHEVAALIAMTHRPAVSVVVPVRDRHDLLVLAVRSICDQSVRDIEIIIVDDGSSPKIDSSLFGRDDARIRILRHETSRGAGAARNSGVLVANGEFLAFLDSDDIWHPRKLEIQLGELMKFPAETPLVVASGWRYFHEGRAISEIAPVATEDIGRFAAGSWFYPGSTPLMRRETALAIGPQDETLPRLEDYDWYLRFALRGGKLAVVAMPLVDVRWHRGSIFGKVRQAGEILQRKYLRPGGEFYIDDPAIRRRIRSYIALSEASAAWHQGHRVRGLTALAHSLMLCPRPRIQIEKLWSEKRIGAAGREPGAFL
jgi:glycosyltransferase involved in cell wall biosynthesis